MRGKRLIALGSAMLLFTACGDLSEDTDSFYETTHATVEPATTEKPESSMFYFMAPVCYNFIANSIYESWDLSPYNNINVDYDGVTLSLVAEREDADCQYSVYYYEFETQSQAEEVYNSLVKNRYYDIDIMNIHDEENSYHEDFSMSDGTFDKYNYFCIFNNRVVWGTCDVDNTGETSGALRDFIDSSLSSNHVEYKNYNNIFRFNKVFSFDTVVDYLKENKYILNQLSDTSCEIRHELNATVGYLTKDNNYDDLLCRFVNKAVECNKTGYTGFECAITTDALMFKCTNLETQKYCYYLIFDGNELMLENSASSYMADMTIIERLWTQK